MVRKVRLPSRRRQRKIFHKSREIVDPITALKPETVHNRLLSYYFVGFSLIAGSLVFIFFIPSKGIEYIYRFFILSLKFGISFMVILFSRALVCSFRTNFFNVYERTEKVKGNHEIHKALLEFDGVFKKQKFRSTNFNLISGFILIIYGFSVLYEIFLNPVGFLGVLIPIITSIAGGLVIEQFIEREIILPFEKRESFKNYARFIQSRTPSSGLLDISLLLLP